MTIEIIIQILLLAIALSMDAFAVSITDGLIYQDINKKKALFIALTFGVMQGLMPLIGYWLVELVEFLINEGSAGSAGNIMSLIVVWTAFGLLLFLGTKMLVEGILALKKKEEEKPVRLFSYKEVLFFGLATSIDALGSGVALHSGLSNNITIFIHISIIIVITFVISLLGVLLGNKIEKLLKGKVEITSIIGGCILLILAIWIVLSHYLGI
jgi:putative Mn2+ efflux pump MntP